MKVCHAMVDPQDKTIACGATIRPFEVGDGRGGSYSGSLRFITCKPCIDWMRANNATSVEASGQEAWAW